MRKNVRFWALANIRRSWFKTVASGAAYSTFAVKLAIR